MPSSNKPDRVTWRSFWLPLLLIVYLVIVLIVASGVALQSWPDNPLRQRLYVVEAERLAILQVTDEGITALDRALAVAAQLPVADDATPPKREELNLLVTEMAFAQNLLRSCADQEIPKSMLLLVAKLVLARNETKTNGAFGASPLRWNRQMVANATATLLDARKRLEKRSPCLVPSALKPKPWDILRRVFFPAAAQPIEPALTSSEQAQVAVLLADMNNPRTAAESKTAIAQQVRPLLDRVQDTDFILLVLALGAWGASAQALASIATYLGVRRFSGSWAVFYLTRPLIGATLAFTFYIAMRGGLLTRDATWTDINHVGYAAISLLVGFFATEAMENLKRIASGIFADKDKTDGLSANKPVLLELRWAVENTADYLELIGKNIATDAQVIHQGKPLQEGVQFVSPQKLRCAAPPTRFAANDTVQVRNPEANATPSETLRVPTLPTAPVIEEVAYEKDKNQLTVTGRRFEETVAVLINGKHHTDAIPESSTKILVALPAAQVPDGTEIRVINLAGDGGTSDVFPVK